VEEAFHEHAEFGGPGGGIGRNECGQFHQSRIACFVGGSSTKPSSAPIMPIVIMIDIDDHADGASGADHAGSDDHHDGGGAQSTMMPIMAVEFVAARS
jgi:hypothetical protein